MSYVKHVLQPGETIIQTGHLHWLIFWRAILFLIVAIALAIGSTLPDESQVELKNGLLIAAGVMLLVAVLFFLAALIRRATTELAVTDQRVIFKQGLLSRHTIEMNRTKVESVNVDQTIAGRIFNYGTILIRGTGGSLEPLRDIEDPLTLRSRITAN